MPSGLFVPMVAVWLVSGLCYVSAGLLMWRRLIPRNAHISLTVAGFLADISALAMQKIHLMQLGVRAADLDPTLRTLHGIALDVSMGLYCVVALFGFARIVGWPQVGRWHVPMAMLFLANWAGLRVLSWMLLNP